MKATLSRMFTKKRKSGEGAQGERGQEKFGTLPSHKISPDQTIPTAGIKEDTSRRGSPRGEAAKRGGFPELWQDHFE